MWKDKTKIVTCLSSVQFSCSVMSWLFATPWTIPCQASLSITNSQSLPKLMSIESVMPSNHLILCHPLLLPPSIFPSIRVFSNESALLLRWPKYWSFSFSLSPSSEHPGLISFSMDWLELLAVQGTLKSLAQHHSSKASILWHSAFFIVQLTHPCSVTCGQKLEDSELKFTFHASQSKTLPMAATIFYSIYLQIEYISQKYVSKNNRYRT